jgi:hypothetical protein
MTEQKTNNFRFFVYVIESPSPVDLYHGRSEGDIIKQAACLNHIHCSVKTAVNSEAFEASIKLGLKQEMEIFKEQFPVLHISAHGYEEGIQLTSGEQLTWAQFRLLLHPVNQALNGNLIVCLSSCQGYSGTRMAMHLEDDGYPFFAIIANAETPLWSDTAVAYSTFYHLLAKGAFIMNAVEAMRVASGNSTFFVQTAEQSRLSYIEYIQQKETQPLIENLEDNLANESPGHLDNMQKLIEK